jgi:hypothetical protein
MQAQIHMGICVHANIHARARTHARAYTHTHTEVCICEMMRNHIYIQETLGNKTNNNDGNKVKYR